MMPIKTIEDLNNFKKEWEQLEAKVKKLQSKKQLTAADEELLGQLIQKKDDIGFSLFWATKPI